VLAGVLGAVIAGAAAGATLDSETLGPFVAAGAWLHGRAGVLAADAEAGPGHPIVALDVAEALPAVIRALLEGRRPLGSA
jgi:NAD(P)H-hydrate repair Nnr-like enzyme with NAD(P)H-hydrate dehydratase domain